METTVAHRCRIIFRRTSTRTRSPPPKLHRKRPQGALGTEAAVQTVEGGSQVVEQVASHGAHAMGNGTVAATSEVSTVGGQVAKDVVPEVPAPVNVVSTSTSEAASSLESPGARKVSAAEQKWSNWEKRASAPGAKDRLEASRVALRARNTAIAERKAAELAKVAEEKALQEQAAAAARAAQLEAERAAAARAALNLTQEQLAMLQEMEEVTEESAKSLLKSIAEKDTVGPPFRKIQRAFDGLKSQRNAVRDGLKRTGNQTGAVGFNKIKLQWEKVMTQAVAAIRAEQA